MNGQDYLEFGNSRTQLNFWF